MDIRSKKKGVIDFIEDFALAEDRTIPLKQLIPGTEDFYYYHALHYLNTSQFVKTDEILSIWISRYDRTTKVIEIEHRKALLQYDIAPRESIEYLKDHFDLNLDHQKYVQDLQATLPSYLTITDEHLKDYKKKNLERYAGTTNGFELNALPSILHKKIAADLLRHLLQRLERPDIDNLANFVVQDLSQSNSSGFGSLEIHRKMTLKQLDQCIKINPDLKNESAFIYSYLKRLQPENHIKIENHNSHRENYLKRLWQFVENLNNTHNSLKAHVLYYWLKHEQDQGKYSDRLFEMYLRIPKSTPYVNNDYISDDLHRYSCADLHEAFQNTTLFPPINDDHPLIREYLGHFFIKNKTYEPFTSWVDDKYLKELYAETMILTGSGNMETWYSALPAGRYEQLKNCIDLEFISTNNRLFTVNETISLGLKIKNINVLIIKVFNKGC